MPRLHAKLSRKEAKEDAHAGNSLPKPPRCIRQTGADGSSQGRDFQTRHAEMDLQLLQGELASMGYFWISQIDGWAEGACHLSSGHPKSFPSRGGDPWEPTLAVLNHLSDTLWIIHRVQFPTHPAPHAPPTRHPQYSSAQGPSQHPGPLESVPSKQMGTQPIWHLCQKVHLESDLLLDHSDSLLRQASNRSYYKYIYSSIKSPFIQMIGGLSLSSLALTDAYTRGGVSRAAGTNGAPALELCYQAKQTSSSKSHYYPRSYSNWQ